MELHLRPPIRAQRLTLVAVGLLVMAVLGTGLFVGLRLTNRSADPVTALVAAPTGSYRPVPPFSHVFTIILENKSASAVIGSPDTPYLNEPRRSLRGCGGVPGGCPSVAAELPGAVQRVDPGGYR